MGKHISEIFKGFIIINVIKAKKFYLNYLFMEHINKGLNILIQEKVKQILPEILKADFDIKQSLFTGTSGNVLSCFYLSKMLDNDELYDKAFNDLNSIIDDLEKSQYLFVTYCTGLSGFGVLLCHLIEKGFIDCENDSILTNIDRIVSEQIYKDINNNNFDFLHGGIGNGFYMLERSYIDRNMSCISSIIEHFDKTLIKAARGIFWYDLPSIMDDPDKSIVNLSLSHGLCSKIIFFCRCIKLNILRNSCTELLTNCVNYLISNKEVTSLEDLFPSKIISDKERIFANKLSWCYGDLGIAIALITASKTLNRLDWLKEAISIGVLAMNRNNSNRGIIDCQFCHGSAGVSQIFRRFYLETGSVLFETESNKWLEKTIIMGSQPSGVAGYRFWQGKKWGNNHSLLEGVAGVGLVLQAAISGETDSSSFDWDRIFLLS